MKKLLILMLTGIMVLLLNCIVLAADYVYRPPIPNLYDLDHNYAYRWGINLASSDSNGNILDINSETITGAALYFHNIQNWDNNDNILHVSLLDETVPLGLAIRYDNENPSNFWDSRYDSTLLFQFENLNTTSRDITVNLTNSAYDADIMDGVYDNAQLHMPANGLSHLIDYATINGIFGLGFDPDCHYYNCGIELRLTTTTENNVVPEPATLFLFGTGLLCFASRMRKKNRA